MKPDDLNVLVVGSGAREHAIVRALHNSRSVSEVYAAPGNAGMENLATCVPIATTDFTNLVNFACRYHIDLTVVGGEEPLAGGIRNAFAAAGLTLFGPTREAAKLEGSKRFAKRFMESHGIPTARFVSYAQLPKAFDAVRSRTPPFVVKLSGLAAGKGVRVVHNEQEHAAVLRWLNVLDQDTVIVVEDFLTGSELSVIVLVNGTSWCWLGDARDAKRAFDGNNGPMTGGMGAYSPVLMDDAVLRTRIEREIITPTVDGMVEEGHPYEGFLYVGLMLTDDGPMVLEYNVRLGDPEAQVILPRLQTEIGESLFDVDFAGLLLDTMHGTMPEQVPLAPVHAVGVVLASEGYPGTPKVSRPIRGLGDVRDAYVYTGGVRRDGEQLVTSGGRICTVVGMGERLADARQKAYAAVTQLEIEGAFFRKDIGTF